MRYIMTPGQRIRKLRVQNNLGQKVLADELGYKTYTTISKWESDKSLPPGRELKKLAKFFGVSVDYILGLDNLTKVNKISAIADATGLAFYDSAEEAFRSHSLEDTKQETVEVPQLTLKEDQDHYFALEIKNDSINKLIPVSYNVIVLDFSVAEDTSLDTGDIIIVKIDDKFRIVTLRKTDLTVYLEPSSYIEGFETISLSTEEFEDLELVGKVVASYRIFD